MKFYSKWIKKKCKKGGKTHPRTPRDLTNIGIPSDNPLSNPSRGCTLMFTTSKGKREISPINSTDAHSAK